MENKILKLGGLFATFSLLLPTMALAEGTVVSRSTYDNVIMKDNGETIKAFAKTFGFGSTGITSIDAVKKEIRLGEGLRTTQSRVDIETPKNPYCDGTAFNKFCSLPSKEQDVFPNSTVAREWIASHFTEDVVFKIEGDLANAIEKTKSLRGIYQYTDKVKIRNENAPKGYEEREVFYTIVLDKNTHPGFGHKSGLTISDSEYSTNLYAVYKNSDTVTLLDGLVDIEDAGEMVVYEMDGMIPSESNLKEIARFEDPTFDTSRLKQPSTNFFYKTDGVKNALVYVDAMRQSYSSEIVVFDYHNPVSLKQCPVGEDGECLPEDHNIEDPYFKPKIDIFTTDRSFYRNVCTGAGVSYKQTNQIEADVESQIDRYILNDNSKVVPDMTNEQLLDLKRLAPFDFEKYDNLNEEFTNQHSFDYNTNISYFNDRVTEYLGKEPAPNNIVRPTCLGSDTYEDEACYDLFNGLHHDHYKKPLSDVRNISIVDVIYEEKVKISSATTTTDEDGNEVEVPAKYEWQEKSTCDTQGGTLIYNTDDFCSGDNINCLDQINK